MTANQAVINAIFACLVGAPIALLASPSRAHAGWISFLVTAISSGLAIFAAATVLLGGAGEPLVLWSEPALGSALRFHVDGLSAIFLALIAVIAVLSALYSIRYMAHYRDLGVARYYPWFLLFVAGMYAIVTITDLMGVFFVAWQLMTIPSFFLVRFERQKPENRRAALRYLIMMEVSCALVMLGAGVIGAGGGGAETGLTLFDFDRLQAAVPGLLADHSGVAILALLLFLVGFGIKAGMWPFGQMWLPDAHPAAPSPVSALLSGVMIKTGVYGLLRSFLWLVPEAGLESYPAVGWGAAIAILGTITLFVGTLQALKQEETKRLLAFHSIGQVGYILLGLGASLGLLGAGAKDPAVLALAGAAFAGALFHTLNHGLFKSLLFLNAGSMLHATDTQDLNRLGGLVKYMPLTAATALVASFSIAGVPLFNGFGSKWSIYVASILGSRTAGAGHLAICGVFAIITSALTLASFMKFFGAGFLSPPSRLVEERAREKGRLEVGFLMGLPQIILAALCVLLGLVPALAFAAIGAALASSPTGLGAVLARAPIAEGAGAVGVAEAGGAAFLGPLVLAAVLAALLALAWWISRAGGATRRRAAPWLCGYARESEACRYGAHNLYIEFKRYFDWVGGRKSAPGHREEPANAGSRDPDGS